MLTQAASDFVFQPYALLRRGQDKWDGWYDLQHKNGSPIRSFVRVPSLEGFADAALACQAAEILAEWDMAQGTSTPRVKSPAGFPARPPGCSES